jgi:hypothetical protein
MNATRRTVAAACQNAVTFESLFESREFEPAGSDRIEELALAVRRAAVDEQRHGEGREGQRDGHPDPQDPHGDTCAGIRRCSIPGPEAGPRVAGPDDDGDDCDDVAEASLAS